MSPCTKLRVAYVIDALYAPAGGTEGQLLHLLDGLDRNRIEPVVFCLGKVEGTSVPVATEVLDLHLAADFSTLQQIWAFSRTRKGSCWCSGRKQDSAVTLKALEVSSWKLWTFP